MGLRFFRRTKILPGVTLNWSKSGPSVSFGPRGLKHTIGPRGSRTTIGIPGTGLSYTTHHSNSSRSGYVPQDDASDGFYDKRRAARFKWATILTIVTGAMALGKAPEGALFWPGMAFLAVGTFALKWAQTVVTPIDYGAMMFRGMSEEAEKLYRKMNRRFWYTWLWVPFTLWLGVTVAEPNHFIAVVTGVFAALFYVLYWVTKSQYYAIQPPADAIAPAAHEPGGYEQTFIGDRIDDLTPIQFEQLTGMLLTQMGYQVKTTPVTGDGGVDLIAYDPTPIKGGYVVVQCKHTDVVGSPDVRDLFGAMQHHGANKGILVTSGRFSQQAQDWAVGKPIELVDRPVLERLIQENR